MCNTNHSSRWMICVTHILGVHFFVILVCVIIFVFFFKYLGLGLRMSNYKDNNKTDIMIHSSVTIIAISMIKYHLLIIIKFKLLVQTLYLIKFFANWQRYCFSPIRSVICYVKYISCIWFLFKICLLIFFWNVYRASIT